MTTTPSPQALAEPFCQACSSPDPRDNLAACFRTDCAGSPNYCPEPVGDEALVERLEYLLAAVDVHADMFPVPSHMREHVAFLRRNFAAIQAIPAPATDAGQSADSLVEALPPHIAEQVVSMGRVEWGATAEKVAADHVAGFAETLRITREHFNYEDVPVALHGLYLEGTETVLCHTGTSPNSGPNAQALAGAWNWLHEQALASLPKSPSAGEEA